MMRRTGLTVGLLLAAIGLIAQLTGNAPWQPPTPTEERVVRLAIGGPMTGPAYRAGDMMWKAALLVRRAYPELLIGDTWYRVELVRCDDRGQVASAGQLASAQLAPSLRVLAAVGPPDDATALAAHRHYGQRRVPQVNPFATASALCSAETASFRLTLDDAAQAAAIVAWLRKQGRTRALVLGPDGGLVAALTAAARPAGLTLQRASGSPDDQLSAARAAGALVLTDLHDGLLATLRGLRTSAPVPLIIGSSRLLTRAVADDPSAEGVVVVAPAALDTPAVRAFEERFRARHGTRPDPIAALTHDACHLILETLARLDEPGVDALRLALRQRWTAESPFPGITGPVWFDARGNRAPGSAVLHRISGRRFVALPAD